MTKQELEKLPVQKPLSAKDNKKALMIAVSLIIITFDIAVVGGLCRRRWDAIFPVFDFVIGLNLMFLFPLVFFVNYKIYSYKKKPPRNESLLRKLRREANELYGMEFFIDTDGNDVYNVGYRTKVKPWFSGGIHYCGNKEDAIDCLKHLRRTYILDEIAKMRAARREAEMQEEVRKL